MKIYKGSDVSIEPPPEGWSIVIFGDGYKAQCAGAKIISSDGKEFVQFYLMPFEGTIKRFGIDIKKDLDRNGYCLKNYPKEMVHPLNSFDPSRKSFFCILNWDGQETEATNWFLGKEQADEIIRLKNKIRQISAYNERLREENLLLKTNVQKYIKQ